MASKYTVRIFDGQYTSIYNTEAIDATTAQAKIVSYHVALGGTVQKVTTTKVGK